MIQLHKVFKFYKTDGYTRIVLDHVSTVFQSGRSYGLLGVNGAGKSTTMRLIAGIELPNSGRIRRSVRSLVLVRMLVAMARSFDHEAGGCCRLQDDREPGVGAGDHTPWQLAPFQREPGAIARAG